MADIQLNELDELTVLEEGTKIYTQKTLDVAGKKLDTKNLLGIEGDSGIGGLYVQKMKIGSWNMKSSMTKSFSLTNVSNIAYISVDVIFDDDGRVNMPWALYDSYFMQSETTVGTVTTSGSGTTSSISPGTSDNAYIGNTGSNSGGTRQLVYAAYINSSGTPTAYYNPYSYAASRVSTGIYRISKVGLDDNFYCFAMPEVEPGNTALTASVRTGTIDYKDVMIQSYVGDKFNAGFNIEIYNSGAADLHTHGNGDPHNHSYATTHNHTISLSSSGATKGGPWGRSIIASVDWAEGETSALLWHNNFGLNSRFTSLGTPLASGSSFRFNKFQQTGVNRGFLNIYRKATT